MSRTAPTVAAVALALGALPAAGLVRADDAPPIAPPSASAVRYSSEGADITWARATDDRGAVRGYEVTRDGVSLGVRDALSVVERGLEAGRSYAYTIAAVDSAGQRSVPIAITLGTIGSSTTATAPDSPTGPVKPPSGPGLAAPTGLRATAYSRTAGEIGWTRPSTFGLRYEVSLDGALVAMTDGISYVARGLSGGRDYRYEVVAIDRQGGRSAPASVTLRTLGTATGETPPDPATPPDPGATLAAPSGLRASVYSATSAELFWTRPDTFGLRYEVRRDGRVIATTDGVGYYENALERGREYAYEIVAIDRRGTRSAPSAISVRTNGGVGTPDPVTPPTDSVIDLASYEAILRDVVATLNERRFGDLYVAPYRLEPTEERVTGEPTSVPPDDAPLELLPDTVRPLFVDGPRNRRVDTCNAGGDVTLWFDDRFTRVVREVDGCVTSRGTLDGLGYSTGSGAADGTFVSGQVGSSVSEESGRRTFTGERVFTTGRGFVNQSFTDTVETFEETGDTTRRLDGFRSARTIRGPLSPADAETYVALRPDGGRVTIDFATVEVKIDSDFTLRSTATGDRPVTVVASLTGKDYRSELPSPEDGGTPLESLEFQNAPVDAAPFNGVDEPFFFSSGRLTITADDGSEMTVTPAGADSWDVTIGDMTVPVPRDEGLTITCAPVPDDRDCSLPLYRQSDE